MTFAELLARVDRRLRPLAVWLPASWAIQAYSLGRRAFLARLRPPTRQIEVPPELAVEAWGLSFRSPLGNAAGLFKHGEGAQLAAAWGLGCWLVGTTTARPREGNRREGIRQPFVPYPRSGAASNWLGLPNPGHRVVAARLAATPAVPGMVRAASLAIDPPDPERTEAERLDALVAGMARYEEAGVDLLEINESCPNTEGELEGELGRLERRLRLVAVAFLASRRRRLPVLLKLSVDVDRQVIDRVVPLACELGFDGLVLGNTSTRWSQLREQIDERELALFDRFVSRFGGGVSGRPLASEALALVSYARRVVELARPKDEFHLIRVGGIESAADVVMSQVAGATLCQWYTGLFEAFARDGHAFQARLHQGLVPAIQDGVGSIHAASKVPKQ